eukprot:TRINITY_DN293_c0_g1_i1.p1 TRINITY_DN293_c0_g1~~TRINITY_DN293_c0_g1_i1.p1  ORF type:complete len:192 (+),score=10.00 TRINITY_DN293_c0_g1_i1:65-640(+)
MNKFFLFFISFALFLSFISAKKEESCNFTEHNWYCNFGNKNSEVYRLFFLRDDDDRYHIYVREAIDGKFENCNPYQGFLEHDTINYDIKLIELDEDDEGFKNVKNWEGIKETSDLCPEYGKILSLVDRDMEKTKCGEFNAKYKGIEVLCSNIVYPSEVVRKGEFGEFKNSMLKGRFDDMKGEATINRHSEL